MNFELEKYKNELPLIKETAEQVIKDFQFYDIEIIFKGEKDTAYEELFEQVFPAIGELLNSQFEKLMSLLYKIDVNDRDIERAFSEEHDQGMIISRITDLILRRELLKVLTRNHFRQQRLNEGDNLF